MHDRRSRERWLGTTIRSPFDLAPAREKKKRELIPSPVRRYGGQVERNTGKEAGRYGSSDATSSVWIATEARAATAL
ncbi:hypothetical protein [Burkholderia sp. Z1]|uniref:hypothetical protein n=1 Tax=Burkholderia sp. Z1 TaxID=2759039 RepID=UPI00186935C7|nr:hypothetical protein [Burkholderia sp. Z1]